MVFLPWFGNNVGPRFVEGVPGRGCDPWFKAVL